MLIISITIVSLLITSQLNMAPVNAPSLKLCFLSKASIAFLLVVPSVSPCIQNRSIIGIISKTEVQHATLFEYDIDTGFVIFFLTTVSFIFSPGWIMVLKMI